MKTKKKINWLIVDVMFVFVMWLLLPIVITTISIHNNWKNVEFIFVIITLFLVLLLGKMELLKSFKTKSNKLKIVFGILCPLILLSKEFQKLRTKKLISC